MPWLCWLAASMVLPVVVMARRG